ncbi:MAG: hypothetical protein OJF50_003647 [Nitrospira sp.]|nr:hypothetical protein [Nitrospira sp.]
MIAMSSRRVIRIASALFQLRSMSCTEQDMTPSRIRELYSHLYLHDSSPTERKFLPIEHNNETTGITKAFAFSKQEGLLLKRKLYFNRYVRHLPSRHIQIKHHGKMPC